MFKRSIFKISNWRIAAILKNVKCGISAAVKPILKKFGMMMHLKPFQPDGKPKISKFQNPRWRTTAIFKIGKLRYLQNCFAILLKFCTMTHISSPEFTSCSKN